MRISPFLIAIVALVGFCTQLMAIKVGDTEAAVIAELGKPGSEIPLGANSRLLGYERGNVVISNGKVTKVDLVSATENENRKKLDEQRQKEGEARKLEEEKAAAATPPAMRSHADHDRARAQDPAARFAMKYRSGPTSPEAPIFVKELNMRVISETTGISSSMRSIGGGGKVLAFSSPKECEITLTLVNKSQEEIQLPAAILIFTKDGSTESLKVSLRNTDSFMPKGVPSQFSAKITFSGKGVDLEELSDFDRVSIRFFSKRNEVDVDRPVWLAAGVK